jgi:tetratricopeptide (TPR) repeat protein
MTRNSTTSSGQPSIDELMVRFLANGSDIVESSEFVPHEVAAGFRVDPRAAWKDATENISVGCLRPALPVGPIPNDWAYLVNLPCTAYAVPMALGNFPQRVRDLQPLLTNFAPQNLRPSCQQSPLPGLIGLRNWITANASTLPILAGGLARTIGDYQLADHLLPFDALNERAALEWHRGECVAALTAWQALPDSPEVRFNRGMAYLFVGQFAEARRELSQTIELIPKSNGWHALAQLYRAVAEICLS